MAAPARSLKLIGTQLEVMLVKTPKKCPYAEDLRKLLAEILSLAGYTGRWSLTPTRQQQGDHAVPRFRFIRQQNGVFTARLRSGGNDSVWDCEITPVAPHGYADADVERDLRHWDGWNGQEADAAKRQVEARVEVSASRMVDRINALEARANGYRQRQKAIDGLEARYEQLLTEAGAIEAAIGKAREEMAADHEGQGAITALEQLNKLIN